ncbi:hypothetical protein [Ornithinimicrobium kibberense]|uniref:hypothetical protein n=1 Tax=Ornithinimicrobium kibberense TaxID=282060 RepID=UPI00361960E7
MRTSTTCESPRPLVTELPNSGCHVPSASLTTADSPGVGFSSNQNVMNSVPGGRRRT